MFEFLNDTETQGFTWNDIGNISDGRQNLGEDMPVFVYRLLQFTMKDALIREFGKEKAIQLFRNAGELAGKEFASHFLDFSLDFAKFTASLQKLLEDSKIGVLRIERFDPETGFAILTISEDLDCSGLPITGETVCNYDEGFLAGILKAYTNREYIVTEVDCWASGSRVCRFEAEIR